MKSVIDNIFRKSICLGALFLAISTLPQAAHAADVTFLCKPTEIIEHSNRIHVRCSETVSAVWDYIGNIVVNHIRYLAISKTDKAKAARFTSQATAAFLSGKTFYARIPQEPDSNVSGCNGNNCRTPTKFGVRN